MVGREIDGVAELGTDLSGRSNLRGPVNNQRVSHAAAVSILLVPFQWSIARLRPSPRDIAVAIRSADVVQTPDRRVEIFTHAVELAHLVEHAGRATLLAGAVVGHHDEQRVVEQVELF